VTSTPRATLAKPVLFVSHDALRTGATLILLNLLDWLKEHTDIRFDVLTCQRGEMEVEFEKRARMWKLDLRAGRAARLRAVTGRLLGNEASTTAVGLGDLASRLDTSANYSLIYSNTVANGRALAAMAPSACPVITHVHELEYSIRRYAGRDFESVKRYTRHYIAVADAVRNNLIDRHGIDGRAVERIYGFVPTAARLTTDAASLKRALSAEIGAAPDARIVGACGTVDWRKGCDLFVQLAAALNAGPSSPPVHCVWVGATPPAVRMDELRYDLEHAGLAARVHFIGARTNPLDYMAAFDILALVSREDPFPLVMLEAAALGVPTACFDTAGGGPEFVENDAGIVVAYLDVTAMAREILAVLQADDRRRALGRRAQEKVRERHDIDRTAPAILSAMTRVAASAGAFEATASMRGLR
jgi:glycosyltransferase involved in cell wall biosynthesis